MKTRQLITLSAVIAGIAALGLNATPAAGEPETHSSNLASQLGILDLTANGGINPATGQAWQGGDRYRLVFLSSARIGGRGNMDATWNSIDKWNEEAQNFAANATGWDNPGQLVAAPTGGRPVKWNVLGSTAAVNARINTATDPALHGSGHAIMRMDGATIVANDFADLWSGEIRNVVHLTENKGQLAADSAGGLWPVTGTRADGNPQSEPLRNINTSGSIRQGQAGHTVGWIDRDNISGSPAARTSSPAPIYAMSEPLFVIDLDDNVQPTLVSFANNVDGGPIEYPDVTVVYTVTFDEAILPQTVTVDDFENAQATPIDVQSVRSLTDPTKFEVTVMALSNGSIQLQIKEGAVITDLNGNPLDTSTALTDTTVIDVEGEMEIVALDPANNATGVYPGIGQLKATFDDTVLLTGEGSVTIKNLTAMSEQVITLPDASVTASGPDLVIALASNLALGTQYAVRISGDAVALYSGINDDTTWTFATAEENLNPPVITTRSPAHQAKDILTTTGIVATFDQPLILGSGDIVIKDLKNDSTTQTIAVTDASQVTLADNVLTVQPAQGLATGTQYAVLIPSTAVRNYSDVDFAGITSESGWTFTTFSLAGLSCRLGILDLDANGGINPATGTPWKIGDPYRLVFISSTFVDPANSEANDIAYWNNAVQAIANSSTTYDLSGVTWKIIGSTGGTGGVDARDNTSTNPAVDGTGHAIFAMDGSTVIENNFVDLWDGTAPVNMGGQVLRDENGVVLADSPAVNWPLTGTGWNGTRHGTAFLKDTSTSGSIRQGAPGLTNGRGWIDANHTNANWFSNEAYSVYGMSEALTVQAPAATIISIR